MEIKKKVELTVCELEPIIKSYSEMSDIGFNAKARIYSDFVEILKLYWCSEDVNQLIEYAINTYNLIDWENDEGVSGFKNQGYLIVIVYILNLFIAENRKANYADFSDKKKDFARVMNIIKSFKVEQNNED